MIDGQDNNDFGVAGASIPLNNPDVIQEVRLVTNQFTRSLAATPVQSLMPSPSAVEIVFTVLDSGSTMTTR